MFNNHTMTVVNDLNILGPSINNTDFLIIAAITSNPYPDLPNIHNASILLPPTEMLMRWADGDISVLEREYPMYLSSKTPDDMIVALIAAMTRRNIVLYIPLDDFNVFGRYLLNHIYFIYGIVCNYMNTVFSVNQSKFPMLISKFYMIEVMDANDYLNMYPSNLLLPGFVIGKLAEDLKPFNGRLASFDEYADYFNRLNMQQNQPVELKEMCTIRKE